MSETAEYWQERLADNIFLAGRMGAGKDFVAARLVEEAGFTRLAFADALKAEVAAHLGISVEELNRRKAEFRSVLQNWGVGQREADPLYWIKRWADARAQIPGPVVCTDVRFLNEAEYGMQIGALVIRVKTPDTVREERLRARDGSFDPATLNHVSEQYIDRLMAHLELPGIMPAWWYVPSIAGLYQNLSELMFRDAVKGIEKLGGK